MSTIADLGEAIAPGLIPDDPANLHATMEGLPGFLDAFAAKAGELAEFTGGTVGEQTSIALTDLAVQLSAAAETARTAFLNYQNESSAWRMR